jgi:hypothetical protein
MHTECNVRCEVSDAIDTKSFLRDAITFIQLMHYGCSQPKFWRYGYSKLMHTECIASHEVNDAIDTKSFIRDAITFLQ